MNEFAAHIRAHTYRRRNNINKLIINKSQEKT